MDDATAAGLALSTATLIIAVFDRSLPPAHVVAERPPTPAYVAHVQTTCLHAAPVALALGLGASLVARSPWPAVAAAAVAAWLWWQYDTAAKAGNLPAALPAGPIGRYGR